MPISITETTASDWHFILRMSINKCYVSFTWQCENLYTSYNNIIQCIKKYKCQQIDLDYTIMRDGAMPGLDISGITHCVCCAVGQALTHQPQLLTTSNRITMIIHCSGPHQTGRVYARPAIAESSGFRSITATRKRVMPMGSPLTRSIGGGKGKFQTSPRGALASST